MSTGNQATVKKKQKQKQPCSLNNSIHALFAFHSCSTLRYFVIDESGSPLFGAWNTWQYWQTWFLSTKDNRGHLTLKIPRKRQISGYDFEGFFAHQTDSLTVGWREEREWDASETFTSPTTELMVSFRPRARPLPRTSSAWPQVPMTYSRQNLGDFQTENYFSGMNM